MILCLIVMVFLESYHMSDTPPLCYLIFRASQGNGSIFNSSILQRRKLSLRKLEILAQVTQPVSGRTWISPRIIYRAELLTDSVFSHTSSSVLNFYESMYLTAYLFVCLVFSLPPLSLPSFIYPPNICCVPITKRTQSRHAERSKIIALSACIVYNPLFAHDE